MNLPRGWFASAARVVCIFRLGGLHLPLEICPLRRFASSAWGIPTTPQRTDANPCSGPPCVSTKGLANPKYLSTRRNVHLNNLQDPNNSHFNNRSQNVSVHDGVPLPVFWPYPKAKPVLMGLGPDERESGNEEHRRLKPITFGRLPSTTSYESWG